MTYNVAKYLNHVKNCGWTLEEYAAHYAETLASPPNGWGQHISPIFGQSHNIMREANKQWTRELVDEAFSAAIKQQAEP